MVAIAKAVPVLESINPATEEVLAVFPTTSPQQIEQTLQSTLKAFRHWRDQSFDYRADLLRQAAAYLRSNQERLASLITLEMGKPIAEAEAEVDKSAWVLDYYADRAAEFLNAQPHPSGAAESYVSFQPIGTVLAIMPWNFPFWQLFRAAAPALMAGNTVILKHASNVPQSALAIEELFRASGFPEGTLRTLLISGSTAQALIADPGIAAVTFTGSEAAGRQVAAAAGAALKKSVLELGGSDPFIVLADADLKQAAQVGARARTINSGQTCIAAKRFIVLESVAEAFLEQFAEAITALKLGNPMDRSTQVGPLARPDLVQTLDRQVRITLEQGAHLMLRGSPLPRYGFFYAPTVLAGITREMPVYREETFGPVAAILTVRNENEAIAVANDTQYGLGAAIWSQDLDRAKALASQVEAGFVAINGMVSADPHLPFGGVKNSGYGRELSEYGIREFTNIQSIWVGPPIAPSPPKK